MKSVYRIAFIIMMMFVVASQSDAQYRERGNWLGPVLTLGESPVFFGAQYEYGIDKNIGIGGLIRYRGESYGDWSWSILVPQFQANYHFMPGDQLDPYAGARLGWAIFSVSDDNPFYDYGSGLFMTISGGLRYFFSPKVAGNGTLELGLIGEKFYRPDFGLSIGVDFTL